MGRSSQDKKIKNFYKIFEQIYENPLLSIYNISVNTKISRNTVSKYVREMYKREVLVGPYIRMKQALNYKEYVYLMNFSDPLMVFQGLKGFPHVIYNAVTFGDWNTLVVTDTLLDFSHLVGFENVVYHNAKYCSYTPKVGNVTWDESFEIIYEQVDRFTPVKREHPYRKILSLPWGRNEWILYHQLNFMRKKVTPTLRKAKVPYETYLKWKETIDNHCTIHTGFYPEGYQSYANHCFLVYTDHEESVKSIFSSFPTTSCIMVMDKQLLVFIHVTSSDIKRKLICLIYDMKTKQMIKGFNHAVGVFNSQSWESKEICGIGSQTKSITRSSQKYL